MIKRENTNSTLQPLYPMSVVNDSFNKHSQARAIDKSCAPKPENARHVHLTQKMYLPYERTKRFDIFITYIFFYEAFFLTNKVCIQFVTISLNLSNPLSARCLSIYICSSHFPNSDPTVLKSLAKSNGPEWWPGRGS